MSAAIDKIASKQKKTAFTPVSHQNWDWVPIGIYDP
jgi:hypothetical protein